MRTRRTMGRRMRMRRRMRKRMRKRMSAATTLRMSSEPLLHFDFVKAAPPPLYSYPHGILLYVHS